MALFSGTCRKDTENLCQCESCEAETLERQAKHERESYIAALMRERWGHESRLPGLKVRLRDPIPPNCGCDRALHRECPDHECRRHIETIEGISEELRRVGAE
jgi:hypothetical protein